MHHLRPILIGLGLAVLSIIVALILPRELVYDICVLLLVGIAAVYLGFAISEGRTHAVILQAIGFTGFFIICIISLNGSHWNWLLALGYFGHGVWDWAHHQRPHLTQVISWYPPFCTAYDWLMAVFIFLWW